MIIKGNMKCICPLWCYVIGELEPSDITDFDFLGTDIPVQLDGCPQQFRLELFRDVFVF